jgi:UDP-N-acetylglucosamine 2-epimerase (non-hydrolysing)
MVAFEQWLPSIPGTVVVVGDVDSTLACALVAAKANRRLVHVEAGLRSFDRSMPEEINRIVTDTLSDVLYTTCDDGTNQLIREGVDPSRICQAGNVMIDTLVRYKEVAARRPLPLLDDVVARGYALVTVHRPSNVDDDHQLAAILTILEDAATMLPVVLPLHPRTRSRLETAGLLPRLRERGIFAMPPQGYLTFMAMMMRARVVLTDSGGIQEETTALGIPCITLRRNTERPVTVTLGTNELVGMQREAICGAVARAVRGEWKPGRVPEGWDGMAAARIAADLIARLPSDDGRRC